MIRRTVHLITVPLSIRTVAKPDGNYTIEKKRPGKTWQVARKGRFPVSTIEQWSGHRPPPPDPKKPYLWTKGTGWVLAVTDTADGVPETLFEKED